MSDDARDASGDGDEARDASPRSPPEYMAARRAYFARIGLDEEDEDDEAWDDDDEDDDDDDEWDDDEDDEYEGDEYEGERYHHGMSSFERPVDRVRFENEPAPEPQDPERPTYSDSEIENYSLTTHMWPYYERGQSVVLETTCNHAQGADALRAVPKFVFDEGALEATTNARGEEERTFGPLRDTWVFHRMRATSYDDTVAKRCTLGMPDFFSFRRHAVSACVGGVAEGANPSEASGGDRELFTPYSMDYDEERRLLAVCGMGHDQYYTTFWNVVVYEIDASEETVGTGKNVNPDALYTEVCRLNVGISDDRVLRQVFGRNHQQMDFTETVHQANCIRFARLEGALGGTNVETYLLLSSNDGHVYYIRLSEADEVTRARKAEVVRSDNNKRVPVNCAEPSPCGTMVAYCGDSRRVGVTFLAPPSVGAYCLPLQLEIPSLHPKLPRDQGGHDPHSCQYVRWSPDGRYLAATSDATHSITVWRMDGVNGRDPDETVVPPVVAHFWDHARPVLPVVFAQHNPSIMVWAERKGRMHTFDVREAEDHHAEVADIVKDVPEEELAQLKTMKDGLQDVGCALVNMRRRLRPLSFKASKSWARLDPVERRAIWKKSFVEGDVYKDFTLQTINHFRGFDDAHYATITGLTVSRVAPPQGTHGEDASDVIMCSTGRAVFAYRLVAGVRRDMSNFLSFPLPSYIDSMQTFLLCAKASRRNGRGKTCLADLPTEILHEIMARASTPLYKWSGRLRREKEREGVSHERAMKKLFDLAKDLGLQITRDPDKM